MESMPATMTRVKEENDCISKKEYYTTNQSCNSSSNENIAAMSANDLSKSVEPVASTTKTLDAELLPCNSDITPREVRIQNNNSAKEKNQTREEPVATTSKAFDTESDKLTQKRKHDLFLDNPVASTSNNCGLEPELFKRKKVELYGPDDGPKMYNVKGNLVTPPIIAKNLPEIFSFLPIFGKPESKADMESFYTNKIREFVGFDMNDEKFDQLAKFCSIDFLKTGKELVMSTPYPTSTVLSVFDNKEYNEADGNLCIVKRHRLRMATDPSNIYQRRLKYRGVRLMPLAQMEFEGGEEPTPDLEPGKDIIYRVRIYRPFPYNLKEKQVRARPCVQTSSRHSVLSRDVLVPGRARLSALRERMACANDAGVRLDASAAPHRAPAASARDLFPSGFLFINNTFYVDERPRCADRSAPIRAWARERGLGDFPARPLHGTRLDQIAVRLGYPEVYVHQGNCEHLFTFSEVRLLSADDPLSAAQYPCHSAVSQNQSVYCTTCAEFGAKWVAVGCATVPFDPAYFCDTCMQMYLYKDGEKIGDFKCYSYRGNEINVLKSQG